jgi:hypothetical protein
MENDGDTTLRSANFDNALSRRQCERSCRRRSRTSGRPRRQMHQRAYGAQTLGGSPTLTTGAPMTGLVAAIWTLSRPISQIKRSI